MLTGYTIPNETFPANSPITLAKLRNAAAPSVVFEGTIATSDMDNAAVTADKLAANAVTNVKVATNAEIAWNKMAAVNSLEVVIGDANLYAAGHVVIGDVSLSVPRKIRVQETNAASVGDIIKGGTTGAIGKLRKREAISGADYWYYVEVLSGNFNDDDEELFRQQAALVYDNVQGSEDFRVGDTVVGGTTNASGVVTADNGTALTLAELNGFFDDDEHLVVGAAYVADVNGGKQSLGNVDDVAPADATGHVVVTVDNSFEETPVKASEMAYEGVIGQVLTSNGPNSAPSYQTPAAMKPSCMVQGSILLGKPACVAITSYADATGIWTKTSHGLVDGDVVCLSASSLPSGAAKSSIYYVEQETADTFKLFTDEARTSLYQPSAYNPTTSKLVVCLLAKDGYGCKLFYDSNDDAGVGPSRMRIIFDSAISSTTFVMLASFQGMSTTGNTADYPWSSYNYQMQHKTLDRNTGYCRFAIIRGEGIDGYWPEMVDIVVFTNDN